MIANGEQRIDPVFEPNRAHTETTLTTTFAVEFLYTAFCVPGSQSGQGGQNA